jgi:uncharacterized SAM-binding protein YcdF (DUF218 family)
LLELAGIDASRVVVEEESSTTEENVRFALPLLAERVDIAAVERVLVVAKWYHARRAALLLRRALPPAVRYYVTSYEPKRATRNQWHLGPDGRRLVLREWEAAVTCAAHGDLELAADGVAWR